MAVNARAGAAAWKAAIDGLLSGLATDVSAAEQIERLGADVCSARMYKVDWRRAAVLDDAVRADQFAVSVSDPGLAVAAPLVWQGMVKHHTETDTRRFFQTSSTPGVVVQSQAGAVVSCSKAQPACTTDLSRLPGPSARRRLAGSPAAETAAAAAANAVEWTELPAASGPPPEGDGATYGGGNEDGDENGDGDGDGDPAAAAAERPWYLATETAGGKERFLAGDEVEGLRTAVPGMGLGGATFAEARAAVAEERRRRKRAHRKLRMAAGDGLRHPWSDPGSWLGDPVPVPAAVDIVYVPAGTTLLLDTDVYIRFFVVEGTMEVPSDLGRDLILQAQAVIVNGPDAKFLCGSPSAPHPHRFELVLHGDRAAPQLPQYGIKTLAMTGEGEVYFRGQPVAPTWALLYATATAGATSIRVTGSLSGWQAGDAIVVAGTGVGSEAGCSQR